MTTLVTLVLSNADKLPIVGSPINHATSWYRKRSHSQGSDLETPPPPPYENEPVVHSRLTQISDYVWKRASFSSNTASSSNRAPESYTALPSKEEPFNKEKITEGISLIQMATEMNNAPNGKNQQVSVDLYMMGLDKILASLPIDSDPAMKASLEAKLTEFKRRCGLVLHDDQEKKSLSDVDQKEALGGLSHLIIHAAVLSAVALKKSSIPGMMSRLIEITKIGFSKIDETCSIRERTSNLTNAGIAKAIEMDRYYEVHQFFAEVFYTGCTAILKAGIAYAEYDQTAEGKEQENNTQVA
ncbi:hypothetical protein HMPREF1544_00640 [Mucor circinelloides 1006PhL]|uniref:Uncharacterized protein n=1 Tax=Mucor circinelloides f. circinelloides (strain 1006PhL) TaxID=1220926 RepID=S2JQP6_MUCC1|nr:hypothetical protein HMPREF1544_00640 [Mucor circinelloides 1006PhL]